MAENYEPGLYLFGNNLTSGYLLSGTYAGPICATCGMRGCVNNICYPKDTSPFPMKCRGCGAEPYNEKQGGENMERDERTVSE